MKKKYESQINLSKTNNRIDCLKSKNEYTEKAIDEHQNVLCEVMQKLVVEELDNTLQKYKEVKKNIANCWRTCENLEGESTGRQWNLDQLNILNEKADQLIQSIDAHKSDLTNIHQRYVENDKHFTERLTQLQEEQNHLSAKLSECRAEKNRRENIMASKKAQLDEETQQIIDKKLKIVAIETQISQLENDIENLPTQGLQQKKMYQEKLSFIQNTTEASKKG